MKPTLYYRALLIFSKSEASGYNRTTDELIVQPLRKSYILERVKNRTDKFAQGANNAIREHDALFNIYTNAQHMDWEEIACDDEWYEIRTEYQGTTMYLYGVKLNGKIEDIHCAVKRGKIISRPAVPEKIRDSLPLTKIWASNLIKEI